MKVPLLDLKAQHSTIRSDIRQAIERVVGSQHFWAGSGRAGTGPRMACCVNRRRRGAELVRQHREAIGRRLSI
jgi:hypothetical protein